MSLVERLVLLHVGSTAVLLVALGLVTALRSAVDRWGARRPVVAPPMPAQAPGTAQQAVHVLEPRVVDLRSSREPHAAGGVRRTS